MAGLKLEGLHVIYKCNKYPEKDFVMNKLKKEKLQRAMMTVLAPIGMMTMNEWLDKTFRKFPELDTAEYGNYFRNAQQVLKKKENVDLIAGQWTLLRYYGD